MPVFDVEKYTRLVNVEGVNKDEAALQCGVQPSSIYTLLRRHELGFEYFARVVPLAEMKKKPRKTAGGSAPPQTS